MFRKQKKPVDELQQRAEILIQALTIKSLVVTGGADYDDVFTVTIEGWRKW